MYRYTRWYRGFKIIEEVEQMKHTFKATVGGSYLITTSIERMCQEIDRRMKE